MMVIFNASLWIELWTDPFKIPRDKSAKERYEHYDRNSGINILTEVTILYPLYHLMNENKIIRRR